MHVSKPPSLHALLTTVKKGTVNFATIKSFYQLLGLFNSPTILFCAIIAEALRRSQGFMNLITTRCALSAQFYLTWTNLQQTAQCARNCSAWHVHQGPTVIYIRRNVREKKKKTKDVHFNAGHALVSLCLLLRDKTRHSF